jgi:hypothetical protein
MKFESFPTEDPTLREQQIVEGERENEGEAKEKERGFKLDFYITDHSADAEVTGNPDKLRELYADIKKDGIDSVRYDWHWRNIEPKPGKYNEESIARYARAKEVMQEAGLKEPTIILSNPPEWAKQLYKEDPEKFFDEYAKYVAEVKKGLEASGGEKVTTVQILNELNNTVYTPIKVEDLPRLCEITREVFRDYNPDIKLMATLIAANTPEMAKWATAGKVSLGTPIEKYLPKLKKIKDSFDVIAVDYYPGMWHIAPGDFDSFKMGDIYKRMTSDASIHKEDFYKAMVKNTDLLKSAFEEIATWGKEYELGEVGMRTNLRGGEKSQRYFYDAFFRGFKKMMIDMREKNLRLPSRVGFYEAMDEPPKDLKRKILRKLTPLPEHDMGMRTGDGERKMILEGSPHASAEERSEQRSQLSKIVSYLRSPVDGGQG